MGEGEGRLRSQRQARRQSGVGVRGSGGLLADQITRGRRNRLTRLRPARRIFMTRLSTALFSALALGATLVAQTPAAKPLDIYVVDTEGGKAALFVSPTGQSLLIDSGNPGGRDTDRLMAAVTEAGLKQIDYLISTHYHVDHIGGMAELVKRIPVGTFIDHGPSVEEREQVQGFAASYAEMYGKAKHLVVKPGDKLPITGLDWRIVTAGG